MDIHKVEITRNCTYINAHTHFPSLWLTSTVVITIKFNFVNQIIITGVNLRLKNGHPRDYTGGSIFL